MKFTGRGAKKSITDTVLYIIKNIEIKVPLPFNRQTYKEIKTIK